MRKLQTRWDYQKILLNPTAKEMPSFKPLLQKMIIVHIVSNAAQNLKLLRDERQKYSVPINAAPLGG